MAPLVAVIGWWRASAGAVDKVVRWYGGAGVEALGFCPGEEALTSRAGAQAAAAEILGALAARHAARAAEAPAVVPGRRRVRDSSPDNPLRQARTREDVVFHVFSGHGFNVYTQCLREMGRPNEAERALERAIRVRPERPEYRHALSLVLRDLGQLHRRIDVPVVLVWGEHDKFFPVDRAREMLGEFSDARLEVVAGAGLFAHEERPAEVAAALLTTLVGAQ